MKSPTPFVLISLVYQKAKSFFAILMCVNTSTVFERNIRNINATQTLIRDINHATFLLVFRFFTNEFAKLLKRAGKNVTLSILDECVGDLFLPARSGSFHLSCSLNGTFFMSSDRYRMTSDKYFSVVKVKEHCSFFLNQSTVNSVSISSKIPTSDFLKSVQ